MGSTFETYLSIAALSPNISSIIVGFLWGRWGFWFRFAGWLGTLRSGRGLCERWDLCIVGDVLQVRKSLIRTSIDILHYAIALSEDQHECGKKVIAWNMRREREEEIASEKRIPHPLRRFDWLDWLIGWLDWPHSLTPHLRSSVWRQKIWILSTWH